MKGFSFLLCVTVVYGKYAWVVPLKDKKVIKITNFFKNTWMCLIHVSNPDVSNKC